MEPLNAAFIEPPMVQAYKAVRSGVNAVAYFGPPGFLGNPWPLAMKLAKTGPQRISRPGGTG
jgi:hypothetical protein